YPLRSKTLLAELPAPMSVAPIATFRHLDAHEAIMRQRGSDPQFVPSVEHRKRKRLAFSHQPPRGLAYDCARAFQMQFRIVVLPTRQPREGLGKTGRACLHPAEQRSDL